MIAHLHVHSHYSFCDSTLSPEEIPRLALERGFTSVALTDTNSLAGAVAFYKACREHHVRPVLGAEVDDPTTGERAIVLVRDWEGWGHLCRLITRRHLQGGPEPEVEQNLAGAWVKGGGRERRGKGEERRVNEERGREKGGAGLQTRDSLAPRRPVAGKDAAPGEGGDEKAAGKKATGEKVPGEEATGEEATGEFHLRRELAALPPEHTILLADSPGLLAFLAPMRKMPLDPGPPLAPAARADSPAHPASPAPAAAAESIAYPLYAELILLPRDPARRRAARATFEAAHRLGLPIVATGDVHFAAPEDRELHRLLQAIGRGSTLGRLDWEEEESGARNQASGLRRQGSGVRFQASGLRRQGSSLTPDASSLTPDPSRLTPGASGLKPDPSRLFPGWFLDRCDLRASWMGLREEIERSIAAIVEACQFDLPLGKWHLPRPHLPAGETPFSRLWKLAFAGLERRRPTLTPDTIERLRHEIEIIDQLGFSDYFLVVNEIVEEARRRGVRALGRGSAANSLVSHALGFTGVDPLRHHLYFERFLNPERGTPPDIDLDFSWKDRDAIVDWAFERFGRDRVALISTTVRLQGRQAIRETAKAMGLADSQISRITRPIPFWYTRSLNLEQLEESFAECRGLPLREEPWRTILPLAQRILGFPHHYGIHCGGIVIAPEPIWRYVPLVRAAKGFVVTQMDMGPVEELGLIKIDLLGNRSLGVYKDALHMIESEAETAVRETPR